MNRIIKPLGFVMALCALACQPGGREPETPTTQPDTTVVPTTNVTTYTTSGDQKNLFKKGELSFLAAPTVSSLMVRLDKTERYQVMEGFGAAVTGSTAYNLLKMTQADRTALLTELFDPKKGVGYSYIRISIGTSDFAMDEYSHCDTKGIENFAIHAYDKRDLIPVLKEIIAINPAIKIIASPWSPPRWMKVRNLIYLEPYELWTSGQLNPNCYEDYATYFVKFILAMKEEGINITSVTIQNEPLNRGNSASLFMGWEEQAAFIRDHLGPAFRANAITSKIIVYDHNYDYGPGNEKYPLKIYADAEASQYVDGSAWHAYGGNTSELDDIHAKAPDKTIYFTEQSIGSWNYSFDGDLMWNMRECCLGTINRWGCAVIMWNLLLDDKGGPNRPGGCTTCYGVIDISSSDYKTLQRNSHYYTMAHLSKVIQPGAYRIKSHFPNTSGFYCSAFINPDQTLSLVAQNDTNSGLTFQVNDGEHSFNAFVPAKGVVSLIW